MTVAAVFTDRDGRVVPAPEPPPAGSYYREIGDYQGAAYERNAFTAGTAQEADFVADVLALREGDRLLDVGCGTARHLRALARRGVAAIGIDISAGLLLAAGGGGYIQADARALPLRAASVDAVMSLCQGGFGITPGGDERILAEMARVLRPGGRLLLTAFSLAFAVRWMAPEDALELSRGMVWTRADVRDADRRSTTYDLWTTCYTPGHLRQLCAAAGLTVEAIWGVEPGAYAAQRPTLAHPELMILGLKP